MLAQVAFENVTDDKSFIEVLSRKCSIWKDLPCDKKCQKNLLGGIERALHGFNVSEAICRKIPIYLQKLYNEDILQEESILEWSEKPSKTFVTDKEKSKALRKYAEPFINWLKTAEDDSCEDSESE